jgi:hypothetical protein
MERVPCGETRTQTRVRLILAGRDRYGCGLRLTPLALFLGLFNILLLIFEENIRKIII